MIKHKYDNECVWIEREEKKELCVIYLKMCDNIFPTLIPGHFEGKPPI